MRNPRGMQTTEERAKQAFGVKVRLDKASGDLRVGMAAEVMLGDEIK